MRVLHVIPSVSARRGGASKAALDMVSALREVGVQAEIACTNDDGADLLEVPLGQITEFAGVPVRFFERMSSRWHPLQEFAYSSALRRWLKDNIENYDVIHVHALFSFASTYAMWLARKRNIYYVAHPIGSLEEWSLQQSQLRKSIYLKLFEKANLSGAARVHFTAESEQDQAQEVVADLRPAVIPLGLELPVIPRNAGQKLRERFALPANSKILLFLGRLHPKKGLEILLQAIKEIDDDVHLLVAGDGDADYIVELRHQIERESLSKQVSLTGYLHGEEKTLTLAGADLFVLVSHSENFGVAVLESLAHGTSVLVSGGVALAAQVKEHKLGKVSTMEISDVSHTLSEMLADMGALLELGERGRAYVASHHDWNALATQLKKMYQEILDSS